MKRTARCLKSFQFLNITKVIARCPTPSHRIPGLVWPEQRRRSFCCFGALTDVIRLDWQRCAGAIFCPDLEIRMPECSVEVTVYAFTVFAVEAVVGYILPAARNPTLPHLKQNEQTESEAMSITQRLSHTSHHCWIVMFSRPCLFWSKNKDKQININRLRAQSKAGGGRGGGGGHLNY